MPPQASPFEPARGNVRDKKASLGQNAAMDSP